jgi:hypothetical protein
VKPAAGSPDTACWPFIPRKKAMHAMDKVER